MTDPCRLCLGMTEVNNCIFGDDNKIYLKMVACLPVKVTKEDTLPKKICDVCSCKLDDFYQFCHRAVEAENRLYVTHAKSEIDEVTSGIPNGVNNVSADLLELERNRTRLSTNFPIFNGFNAQRLEATSSRSLNSVYTQTDETTSLLQMSDIKQENIQQSPLHIDNFNDNEDSFFFDNERLKPEDVRKYRDPTIDEQCEQMEETEKVQKHRTKSKRPKKLKKHKELKIKLKRTRSGKRFAVLTDYKTDTDDELSLKNLKSKERGQKTLKTDAEDREVELLNASDIKTELQEFSWELEVEPLNDEFEPAKEEWNCCVCFLRFFNRTGMLTHYRTHYKSPELFKCELLQVQIVEENEDKSKTYTCPVCEKKFIAKRTYSTHLGKHAVEKPYKCSLCEKTFKNPLEILKHGKKSHTYDSAEQGDGGDLLDKGPRPTSKRFICDMCDETFVYMKYLLAHRNATHPESKGRHLVNRCLHCRREFSHLNSLRRHLRSHSGERNFLCYMCGKALTSREHLKFHLRIHTGFKPNVCKTCGKGFVKKCNLTLHERVHSGERPHVCSHCGKAFSQRSTLVIHERYHSGSRPYVCNLCNKGFVAKGLLSMHMKTSCI